MKKNIADKLLKKNIEGKEKKTFEDELGSFEMRSQCVANKTHQTVLEYSFFFALLFLISYIFFYLKNI